MQRFLQLHFLTCYAPSNLNRDDLGRPKTALFGGTQRLRVSSQSLKRAWRTSEVFEKELKGHIGVRTKGFGKLAMDALPKGLDPKLATKIARAITEAFGAVKGDDEVPSTEQLVHVTPEEKARIEALARRLGEEKREPSSEELGKLVGVARGAADIALFGRMLAAKPAFNVEAACQVAHALSVHKVAVEDDYFTAVDDLNDGSDNVGASHVGTQEFAAAVLYHYVCVDRAMLLENLGGNAELAQVTLNAFAKACLTVGPSGKQSSFASRAFASFALAEKGDEQPRSLAVAFLGGAGGPDVLATAIDQLQATKAHFDAVYEQKPDCAVMNAMQGSGTLAALSTFAST